MIQSIAIQAYFDRMRGLFTRQGFDGSMKIVYAADEEGPQRLLDTDMADKNSEPKSTTSRETVRSSPYTYLFWNRDSLENVVRRSIKVRDGIDSQGNSHFKKTMAASFSMGCVLVSNKANLIEDFSEAFAAEYQNIHNVPVNLKFAYDDRNPIGQGGFDTNGFNVTIIQNLGKEELVSFRVGNLFSYSWNVQVYLNVVSEFADWITRPLKSVVVDLYNPQGVPIASMDFNGNAKWKDHTAVDGTSVIVPETAFVEHTKE